MLVLFLSCCLSLCCCLVHLEGTEEGPFSFFARLSVQASVESSCNIFRPCVFSVFSFQCRTLVRWNKPFPESALPCLLGSVWVYRICVLVTYKLPFFLIIANTISFQFVGQTEQNYVFSLVWICSGQSDLVIVTVFLCKLQVQTILRQSWFCCPGCSLNASCIRFDTVSLYYKNIVQTYVVTVKRDVVLVMWASGGFHLPLGPWSRWLTRVLTW